MTGRMLFFAIVGMIVVYGSLFYVLYLFIWSAIHNPRRCEECRKRQAESGITYTYGRRK